MNHKGSAVNCLLEGSVVSCLHWSKNSGMLPSINISLTLKKIHELSFMMLCFNGRGAKKDS